MNLTHGSNRQMYYFYYKHNNYNSFKVAYHNQCLITYITKQVYDNNQLGSEKALFRYRNHTLKLVISYLKVIKYKKYVIVEETCTDTDLNFTNQRENNQRLLL